MKPWALEGGVLIFTAAELNEKFALRMISILLETSKRQFRNKTYGFPTHHLIAANSEVSSSLETSVPIQADVAHPLHRGIMHRPLLVQSS